MNTQVFSRKVKCSDVCTHQLSSIAIRKAEIYDLFRICKRSRDHVAQMMRDDIIAIANTLMAVNRENI